jgi:threonine/homoserine/homoserine lactone efflux protein
MPMIENMLVLLLAAFPLMGSPGPATLSLAATGSAFGLARSLPYLVGIIVGTTAVLLMIAAGLGTLFLAVPGLAPVIVVLAACTILYLAYRIATAPVLGEGTRDRPAPSLMGGLLLAIANPKAFAAIGAVYAGIAVVPGHALADAASKTAVLFVVIIVVNSVWLLAGASFATLLRRPRVGRAANIVFAVLLVLSVAAALLR